MRVACVILSLIFVFSSGNFCLGALKDVPQDHWGSPAVYDLLSRGVTQGYPDGTFLGDKFVSRYEVTMFLYKLEQSVGLDLDRSEKLVEELKAELGKAKDDLANYKKAPEDVLKYSGQFLIGEMSGKNSTLDHYAEKIDYRLKYSVSKQFERDFRVKLSIDTLDTGFGGGERSFSRNILNIDGGATVNILGFLGDLQLKAGPGQVIHREENAAFQIEDYTVFLKDYPSASYSTRYKGFFLSAFYTARSLGDFGVALVNEFGATVGLPKATLPLVGEVSVSLTPRYLFRDNKVPSFECTDTRGEITLKILPSPKLEGTLLLGMKSGTEPDRSYLNIGLSANDYFGTGTYFSISAHKVGRDYRVAALDKYEFGLINSFDKLILDDTSDIWAELSQEITDTIKVYVLEDSVLTSDFKYGEDYPGTSLSWQGGILFYLPPGMTFEVFYRSLQVPSGIADAADPGNLERLVPKTSETIAASLTYDF